MSFNLFGSATICDIKVGYISTDRGYVEGVSRYDANVYASLNPGTQFIVKNRDLIRYLNINEVNALTPDDLLPSKIPTTVCDQESANTFGLDIYNPDGSLKPDATGTPQPPRIYINGGGGVGAVANPVIGNDGSLLAVDVVDGGYGYRFPPQVDVVALDGLGSGAVAISSLCPPDRVGTFQTFENEEDFEEYDFTNCAPAQVDFGRRFGADGEDLGEWDPSLYASLKVDPIRREIIAYQDFLEQIGDGWWDTRKAKPIEIIAGDKKGGVKYDVQHWAWTNDPPLGDGPPTARQIKMLYQARWGRIASQVEINDWLGTGLSGKKVYESILGHQAKIAGYLPADKNFADSFMNRFAISPIPPSNVLGSDFAGVQYSFIYEENFPFDGEYVFRALADNVGEVYVDNESIFKFRRTKIAEKGIGDPEVIKKTFKAGIHKIRCDVLNLPVFEKVQPSPQLPAPVGPNELLISYRGMSSGSGLERASDTLVRIDDDADNGFDENARFEIKSSTVNARFSNDGKKLLYDGSGSVTIEMRYNDRPGIAGLAITDIEVGGTVWNREFTETRISGKGGGQPGIRKDYKRRGSVTKTINVVGPKTSPESSGTKPKRPTGKSTQSTGEKPIEVFNTLDYINRADRKLFRTNANVWGRDSNFLNRYGVLPFNPAAVEKEEVLVPVKAPTQSKPRATIEASGDKLYVKVTGGGRVKVDFSLKVDDNLFTSGVFAREIVIKTDDNDLKLKRDITERSQGRGGRYLTGKKKEFITGSGTFTGGGTYLIRVIGGSPTSGFKPIDKTTVGFDDDINGGYDENGLLRITNVRVIQESDARYETKQNQVTKVVKKYPVQPNASTDAYAGVHIINWESVEFPEDGNYEITTMVDNNARVFIGNRDGNGKKAIGSGLKSIGKGGDEVIIEKKGFDIAERGAGNIYGSTGKSVDTRFFKKGKYRIRVELEQLPGNPLAHGNPMAFAMTIMSPVKDVQVVAPRSWITNPLGIALKIDPPSPPIPQEPVPKAPGRCPNNPIWTTRFPGGQEIWYPVTHTKQDGSKTWSKFMNRFALSPVPPLTSGGSAKGGTVFSNSWNVEIPYDGFYGMKGTVDNGGRILVDGKVILQGGYSSNTQFSGPRTLENFGSETPKTVKFPLTQGNHTITVEVENRGLTSEKSLGKKTIFSTANWATSSSPKPQFTKVDFKISTSAGFGNGIIIRELDINEKKRRGGPQLNVGLSRDVEVGKVYEVEVISPESKRGVRLRSKGSVLETEEAGDNDWQDLVCGASEGRFFDFVNGPNIAKCKFSVGYAQKFVGVRSGTQKDGVTYSGPELFKHTNPAWSKFMNTKSISPYIPPLDVPNQNLAGTKIFTWSNVNFPESGKYEFKLQSDGFKRLYIDGQQISESFDFSSESVISQFVDLSAGTHEVKVESLDDSGAGLTFNANPRGFALIIEKELFETVSAKKSWKDNPIGISAILIPPPCPLETKGRGKVCDIFPIDPGNGYPAPAGPGYPAVLEVIKLEPVNPGINYGPDDDVIIIKEDGTRIAFKPNLDAFGANLPIDIESTPGAIGDGATGPPPAAPVDPDAPPEDARRLAAPVVVTEYPNIFQSSPTGVNSRFRPVIRVRRDPLDVEPQDILQVTDLVGLKRTGYVDGREYFGAVFYKNGVRFAGYYETPGQLIQVYDTLQESIDAEVTTRPSAILRQGTDITSNDPRLNIPGTPENLT